MKQIRSNRPKRNKPLRGLVFLLCALFCLLSPRTASGSELALEPGWNLITADPGFRDSSSFKNLHYFELTASGYMPIPAEDLVPAKGYWVYAPESRPIKLTGHGLEQTSVSVSLDPGWTVAGNPFGESVYISSHMSVNCGAGAQPLSDSGVEIYAFKPSTGEYSLLSAQAVLAPFRAFLVRSSSACSLVMQNPTGAAVSTDLTVRPLDANEITEDAATGQESAGREIIVAVPNGATAGDVEALVSLAGGTVAGRIPGAGLLQVVVPPGTAPADFADSIQLDAHTQSTAKNYIYRVSAPDDPIFLDSTPDNDYQFASMNALDTVTESLAASGNAPVIAILDTGINNAHEEFSGRLAPGYNFIADNQDTDDDNGHGTRAAGLAAASANNGTGIAGICGACAIMPVKVLDAEGRTTAFAVLAGIYYAADHGASVISISISGLNDFGLWQQKFAEAASYARSRGALVVVSAGNNNSDASGFLPGAAAGMFTVGAVDAADARASFSNYGSAVAVAAPGVQLYTTDRSGYAWFSGTSAAAPLAAGAAGLLLQRNPGWNPFQLGTALSATARAIHPDRPLGTGIIDVSAAMASSPAGGGNNTGGSSGTGPGGTGPGMGTAGVCVVTNNYSTGLNSLRSCINFANSSGGHDTITFSIPSTMSKRIVLSSNSPLPPLTDPAGVTIDGGNEIIIDGQNLLNEDGLTITSSNNTIKNLSIVRFKADTALAAAGIRIDGENTSGKATYNQIIDCRLGTDFQNKSNVGNGYGIIIEKRTDHNTISSSGTSGFASVISGNYPYDGIYISNSSYNTIVKSIIGAKSNGTEVLANWSSGIYIAGTASTNNQIGGDMASNPGNLISGNNENGIVLNNTFNNTIQGNLIGVEISGNLPLANKLDGIRITNSSKSNLVGGSTAGFRNVISQNGGNGVHIIGSQSSANAVLHNYLGVGADGETKLGNGQAGVYLEKAYGNNIGVDGTSPRPNIISDNGTFGIRIYGAGTQNNLIQYNRIGMDATGNACGNRHSGIYIGGGASANRIGAKASTEDGDNYITYNKYGIFVADSSLIKHRFFKNRYYENSDLAIKFGTSPIGHPEITSIQPGSGASCYDISGTKDSGTVTHIYYASNPSVGVDPDPSGYGEGYQYIKPADTETATTFEFDEICFTQCAAVSLIATDADGNTSDFSHWYDLCSVPAVSNVQFTPSSAIDNNIQPVRVTAKVSYVNGMDFVDTVTANLSQVSRSASFPMYDDGNHGDGIAGDHLYGSAEFTIPEGVSAGARNIPITAKDVISKSGSGAGTLTVENLAQAQACGADWPMFSCNSENAGLSTQQFQWPLAIKWTKTSGISSNMNVSPAIVDNIVYIAEQQGKVYALNTSDGSEVWSVTLTGESFDDFTPAVWNDSVFFTANSGNVYSLNKNTGAQNWVYTSNDVINGGSPVVAYDMLYFGNQSGTFYAIDASTKNYVWSFSAGSGLNYSFGETPASVSNGIVYAANRNCYVYALDAFTGEMYWSTQITTSSSCSISGSGTVVGDDYVCSTAMGYNYAFCLDKYTGNVVWKKYNANQFYDSHGIIYNDQFIVGTNNKILTAYDIDNGAVDWQVALENPMKFSSPVVFKNHIYIADGDSSGQGKLYALDPNNNGSIVWDYDIGEFIITTPAVTDNLLVLGTAAGANSSVLAFGPGSQYECDNWTVDSDAPDGPGTLFDCVMAANLTLVDNDIYFSISNKIIKPDKPIPFDSAGGAINLIGTGKNIVVDGTDCNFCSGFEITADNSSITGIAVVQYTDSGRHGIDIQADNVTIDSCYVGTNFIDSMVIGNNAGIYIAGENNKVVNSVISGNIKAGITIDGTDTTGTVIQRNLIGVKALSDAAMMNGTSGVIIMGGAHANQIGGKFNSTWSNNLGNVISGHINGYGVNVKGVGTDNNVIQGNIIGLAKDQMTALPNLVGVQIEANARGTALGGDFGYGNAVSGNSATGVNLNTAPDTIVSANSIGLSHNGSAAWGNGGHGIVVYNSNNTTIGGNSPLKRNFISENGKSGILAYTTDGLDIFYNIIGTDSSSQDRGNTEAGIFLYSSAKNVNIGHSNNYSNTIAHNETNGIEISGIPSGVSIRANKIYENDGKGIVTDADFNLTINSVIKNTSNYTVSGSSTCHGCVVEVFQVDDWAANVDPDPSGAGEGYFMLGYTTTDASTGAWTLGSIVASSNSKYISATVTDTNNTNNTTEFAPNYKLPTTTCPKWEVSSLDNSGNGTLRNCIQEAIDADGNQTIKFTKSGTIQPETKFPTITKDDIIIDGVGHDVVIDGSQCMGADLGDCHGFELDANGGGIKNLTIVNFHRPANPNKSAILIGGGNGNGTGYVITGNKIGTDGTAALPNDYGISMILGAKDNTIGGNSDAERNVISGNLFMGITIQGVNSGGPSRNNTITGNYIGTDASGENAIPNGLQGINIINSAIGNDIGGDQPGEGNVISGNNKNGIYMNGGGGNVILGNYIGTNKDGTGQIPNKKNGIHVAAQTSITIGGDSDAKSNIIAHNDKNGIYVTNPSFPQQNHMWMGNRIYDNGDAGAKGINWDIGTQLVVAPTISNITKTATDTYTITVQGGCPVIGVNCYIELYRVDDTASNIDPDTTAGEGFELIQRNIMAGGFGQTVFSNQVITGGKYVSAILINGDNNSSEFANNAELPQSNCPDFIVTSDEDGGFGTLRQCMTEANADGGPSDITFATGMKDATISLASTLPILTEDETSIKNTSGGEVTIDGGGNSFWCFDIRSSDNEIRGLTIVNCGPTSVTGYGIFIYGAAAQRNIIAGNYIGTDASGSTGLGNKYGIYITDNASNNTVGGISPTDRNVISGNDHGIRFHSNASNNTVIGNYIGTNPDGTAGIANDIGISINDGANSNTIGGTTEDRRNLISGNTFGILIEAAGSDDNRIYGNYIGSDKNGNKVSGMQNKYGVNIQLNAQDNKIGICTPGAAPNLIVYNDREGVLIQSAGTIGNSISCNRIFGNNGKGISTISGGNSELPPPIFESITALGSDNYSISGTTSPPCSGCPVLLYRADDFSTPIEQDPMGAGEAFEVIGGVYTDGTGKWATDSAYITGGSYITATLTDADGNTSEFASNSFLNSNPVLTTVTSTSQDISFYDEITLTATASDPDGDPLTFEWSGGASSPFSATNSATTNWTAPHDVMWATFTVTVSDGKGGMATAAVPVRVGFKDITRMNVLPSRAEMNTNDSFEFTIVAFFSTGDTINIGSEYVVLKNGLGTVDTTNVFQSGNTPGTEEITFTANDLIQVVPVTINP